MNISELIELFLEMVKYKYLINEVFSSQYYSFGNEFLTYVTKALTQQFTQL